jgi:hypothetical protein
MNTVKPVYNNHPRDSNFEAVVKRWWLFRGRYVCCKESNWDSKIRAAVGSWSLFGGGRLTVLTSSPNQFWLLYSAFMKYRFN